MSNYVDFNKCQTMAQLTAENGSAKNILRHTVEKDGVSMTFHSLVFANGTKVPFSKSLNEYLAAGGKIQSLDQLGKSAEFGCLVRMGAPEEECSLADFIG